MTQPPLQTWRDRIREVGPQLCELADRAAVPLFGQMREGRPRPVGSGFLLQCAGELFLITAHHVLSDLFPPRQRRWSDGPNDSQLLVPGPNKRLVQVSGEIHGHPRFDVGALRVRDASELVKRWKPLTLAEVDDAPPRPGAWYFFSGFPVERFERRAEGFAGAGFLYTNAYEPCPAVEHDPETTLCLRMDLNHHEQLDGERAAPPALEGISGCPVWKIFEGDGAPFVARLAAVENSYVKSPPDWYVKTTRWPVVGAMLLRSWPEVFTEPMRLIRL